MTKRFNYGMQLSVLSRHAQAAYDCSGRPTGAYAYSFPGSISPQFTVALAGYSSTFMRYALAVTPKNYLLFLCHFVNLNSQLVQGYRWYDYNYWGGKAKWDEMRANAKKDGSKIADQAQGIAEQAKGKVEDAAKEVQKKVS